MDDVAIDIGDAELEGPPAYVFGQKVRRRKTVRNDGTFRGNIIGYVSSMGTCLQRFYIYDVDFAERGYRVGMKGRELEALNPAQGRPT